MNAPIRSNAIRFPNAWKIFVECVRKWEENDQINYPNGWKYGIPNPKNPNEYLYSDCPGKLFVKFKDLYGSNEITEFRKFLLWLEKIEGKRV